MYANALSLSLHEGRLAHVTMQGICECEAFEETTRIELEKLRKAEAIVARGLQRPATTSKRVAKKEVYPSKIVDLDSCVLTTNTQRNHHHFRPFVSKRQLTTN